MDKIGIIDCGTNTFHLMIAEWNEGDYKIVQRIKTPVKIGEGGINNNLILDDGKKRALITLANFKGILQNHEIENIKAFGTSAFRNATNGISFRDEIRNKLNLPLELINGDREAELIFKGVDLALKFDMQKVLVMDIGGGSVEFIIGNSDGIIWKRSLEIGGQRLVELFHKHDPISAEAILNLEKYLDSKLEELFLTLNTYNPELLAGSSGTFDTLSEIYCASNNLYFDENQVEHPFKIEAFIDIHNKLISKNREDRLQIPGMIEMRVDMIVVASCLINLILTRHQFKDIRVSSYSLKEGALSEMLG